jgi:hypothetical protein
VACIDIGLGVEGLAGRSVNVAPVATRSVQCQAVLAMTAPQFRSALSEASNVATSTSTLLCRAGK